MGLNAMLFGFDEHRPAFVPVLSAFVAPICIGGGLCRRVTNLHECQFDRVASLQRHEFVLRIKGDRCSTLRHYRE